MVGRLSTTRSRAGPPNPATSESSGSKASAATIGSAIAYNAVTANSTIIAFSEGTPSQTICSSAGAAITGAEICGASGRLHCGQVAAAVETWCPQSGQVTSGISCETTPGRPA